MLIEINQPVFTPKTTYLLEKYNQYVFDVDSRLKKSEICSLVEKNFSVSVTAINTLYVSKRHGKKVLGSKQKRAIVTVSEKDKIFFSQNYY
jgi:ribosomal protein L23